MAGKFELYQGKNEEFYFRLKAANGETILASEGYKAKASALNGIESVKTNSGDQARFEVKTASDDRHYFVLKASNGQVIGQSQFYKTRSGCDTGIQSVMTNAPTAEILEI